MLWKGHTLKYKIICFYYDSCLQISSLVNRHEISQPRVKSFLQCFAIGNMSVTYLSLKQKSCVVNDVLWVRNIFDWKFLTQNVRRQWCIVHYLVVQVKGDDNHLLQRRSIVVGIASVDFVVVTLQIEKPKETCIHLIPYSGTFSSFLIL
jgi:hypothetical protein